MKTYTSELSDIAVEQIEEAHANDMRDAELNELKSKFAYLAADFENYKKRMQRQQADIINNANKAIIEKILNVIDDFDRVQESMKTYESNPVICLQQSS